MKNNLNVFKLLKRSISFTLLLVMTSSCCTMFRTPSQKVIITSTPEKADVTIDGYYCGTTPMEVKLLRKYDHLVVVEKQGFFPLKSELKTNQSFKALWNLPAPPVIGAVIDGAVTNTAGMPYLPITGALVGLSIGVGATCIDLYTGASADLYHETLYRPCSSLHFTLVD